MKERDKTRIGETLIGGSPAMIQLREIISKAAATSLPVLITGESGTGKELVARDIWLQSVRSSKPFVTMNTGAVTEELVMSELFGHVRGAFTGAVQDSPGRLAEAQGGTLFLDEIGTTNERFQIALLRVMENQTYRPVGGTHDKHTDARIIAATNLGLGEAAAAGLFRSDLLHRLQVLHIALPPLRERKADIPALVDQFVEQLETDHGLTVRDVTDDVMEVFATYSWPGNIRELKNVLSQAAVVAEGGDLRTEHLPGRILDGCGMAKTTAPSNGAASPSDSREQFAPTNESAAPEQQESSPAAPTFRVPVGVTLRELEREYTIRTLKFASNNKTQAARMLGISRKTLYDKLSRWEDTQKTVA